MCSQRDSNLHKSGDGNVIVKNLDHRIDSNALYVIFSIFGDILSCEVAARKNGTSRGFGFIHYETEDAAKYAIKFVNGTQVGEKTVQVSAVPKPGEHEPTDLKKFINLMDTRTDEQKAGHEEARKEMGTDEGRHASHVMCVQRVESKLERQKKLSENCQASDAQTNDQQQRVKLYVKNVNAVITDESLRALFEPFGTITSVVTIKNEKGSCKGFGFVGFTSRDDATTAIAEMHRKVIQGKPLYVEFAEKRQARRQRLRQRCYPPACVPASANVIVENLDHRIDSNALYDIFSIFGNILSCEVAAREKSTSRGFGFIHYETEDAAKYAIKFVNGTQLGEKTVQVSAVPKPGEREPTDLKKFINLMDTRTDEQQAGHEEARKEMGTDEDRHASHVMCVQREQSKLA